MLYGYFQTLKVPCPLCWTIYMCEYKPHHPLAWPGWLCSCTQGEKRSWMALKWQKALRTLAGLAGRPIAPPLVNLCYILSLLKSYTYTSSTSMHTHCAADSMIHPVSVSSNWMHTVNLQLFSIAVPVSIAYFWVTLRTLLAPDMRDAAITQ